MKAQRFGPAAGRRNEMEEVRSNQRCTRACWRIASSRDAPRLGTVRGRVGRAPGVGRR